LQLVSIRATSKSSWLKNWLSAFAGNLLKEGELPHDLPQITLTSAEALPIAAVLNRTGLAKNAAIARDLLNAGTVRIDGEVVSRDFIFAPGVTHLCQAGKKAIARISLKP